MKTNEELSALKTEIEALSQKLSELSEEELAQVVGGTNGKEHTIPLPEGAEFWRSWNPAVFTDRYDFRRTKDID